MADQAIKIKNLLYSEMTADQTAKQKKSYSVGWLLILSAERTFET